MSTPAQPKVPVGPGTLAGLAGAIAGVVVGAIAIGHGHQDTQTVTAFAFALASLVSVIASRTAQAVTIARHPPPPAVHNTHTTVNALAPGSQEVRAVAAALADELQHVDAQPDADGATYADEARPSDGYAEDPVADDAGLPDDPDPEHAGGLADPALDDPDHQAPGPVRLDRHTDLRDDDDRKADKR